MDVVSAYRAQAKSHKCSRFMSVNLLKYAAERQLIKTEHANHPTYSHSL